MSRSYKGIRAKKNRVYSVEDLQCLYQVSANTVSNWVGAGLRPSDGARPYVFNGATVGDFHKERRERLKEELRPGEFKCRGCQLAVFPDLDTVSHRSSSNGTRMLLARCPECPNQVFKIASREDFDLLGKQRNPNTTGDYVHEDNTSVPGGIGIKAEKDATLCLSANDRIIYRWQTYAGRFAEHTVDQYLASIRFCEQITDGKPLHHFTVEDANKVREHLKQSLLCQGEGKKSKSTVAHTASHLTKFFEWLLKQEGYKRLPRDLPDYFQLPRAVYAKSLAQPAKQYPTLEEAEELLSKMAKRSLMEKRARAMFALAFLGALRADTLVSLRIHHIDMDRRLIIQDATVVRAKNGKSLNVRWFPIQKSFAETVVDWVMTLKNSGFRDQDALFPSSAWLTGKKNPKKPDRETIVPMSTTHAVKEAFAIASLNSSIKYTPHSAKHAIGAERDKRPLTHEQRKAWSQNMGHETEQITQSYYGKLTDDRRAELFEEIAEKESKTFDPMDMSDDKKIEFFDMFFGAMKKS